MHLYDNTSSSGLFADSRAGMLNTRTQRAKYTEIENTLCQLCLESDEDLEHVIIKCGALGRRENITIEMALGLDEEINRQAVEATKSRLSRWMILCQNG